MCDKVSHRTLFVLFVATSAFGTAGCSSSSRRGVMGSGGGSGSVNSGGSSGAAGATGGAGGAIVREKSCQGTPTACDVVASETICGTLLGCFFTPTKCEGTEKDCANFDVPGTCNNQAGCGWIGDLTTGFCAGVARPCSLRDEHNCGAPSTSGCDLKIMRCEGTAYSCPRFPTSDSCLGQLGCRWDDALPTGAGGDTGGGGIGGSGGWAGGGAIGGSGGAAAGGASGSGGSGGGAGKATGGSGGAGGTTGGGGASGPAKLAAPVSSHGFGTVVVGQTSDSWSVTVTNTGGTNTGTLTVTLTDTGAADFSVGEDTCTGGALASGLGCHVTVAAKPTEVGVLNAWLNVAGTPGGTLQILLGVQSVMPPILDISPASYDFGKGPIMTLGNAATQPMTFIIKNTGGTTPKPPVVSIGGADATSFQLVSNNCPTQLQPGATCTATARLYPFVSVGLKQASLTVSSGGVTAAASLQGTVSSTLSINFGGIGSAHVVSTPAGIDCPGTCSFEFIVPTVLVTVTPAAGTYLKDMYGCTGAFPPCTVTMDARDKSVSPILDLLPP